MYSRLVEFVGSCFLLDEELKGVIFLGFSFRTSRFTRSGVYGLTVFC